MADTPNPAAKPAYSPVEHAAILSEALPYMLRYDRQTIVVKFGGHAMGDPELARAFARDIVMLKRAEGRLGRSIGCLGHRARAPWSVGFAPL